MTQDKEKDKLLIGSEEWFAFPELGIPAIKARIDSGAKTSSIHAVNIQPFKRKGAPWVSFEVHPLQGDRRTLVRCEAPVVDRRTVKSSSGEAGRRYVIKTPIAMGDTSWDIEVTLANRDSMGYRMLLGREAMIGRTLVDPGARFAHGDLSASYLAEAYGSLKHAREQGLTLGLLATGPEGYTNTRLVEAAEERGHRVDFIDIRHCYMKLDASAPEIRYRGGFLLQTLDAVIPRVDPGMTFYGCALARQCQGMGIHCLNNADAIAQSRDRLFSLQLLLRHGLDIPVTGFADSPVDTADLIEMVGGAPVVIKLLDGEQGVGAVRADSNQAAETVINALKSVQTNLLVQEHIKEAQGRGLRCLIVDGKVVAAIECAAVMTGTVDENTDNGVVRSVKLSADEKKLVARAAKVMGLCVAGVDIVRSNKGPLLLQIESAPDLEDLETATNRDLASIVIQAVERHVGWQRSLASKAN